ncbi:MAG: hypothetical protein ETSY2_17455 [Candidatus Entotheonella gemina]|uniref:Uncharacterized protein n=1 Tax=Candidatus Entotheonella gemina TaxID=1429439 RepID=W4M7R7_9BACT|nr:MAG: hypothetical protein ETSY2_17455 [Candidatus Entotheonella gemina]
MSRKQEFPELYFNIDLKRNFLGPFIADIIPLIIVSLLLFIVLMTMTRDKEEIEAYGFNASSVLGYCSGLFFVLIISHVFLRDKLAAQSLIYLETLYFIMYFMILIISINSILFSSQRLRTLFHIRDNSLMKLLYWPLILGVFLLKTLIEFY